jgi:hypothetical protein
VLKARETVVWTLDRLIYWLDSVNQLNLGIFIESIESKVFYFKIIPMEVVKNG